MGPGQNFLTRVGLGQLFMARGGAASYLLPVKSKLRSGQVITHL